MADEDIGEAGLADEGKDKARSRLKMIIFIVLGAILVSGLSIFLTWFMLKDKIADPAMPNISDIPMDEPVMTVENGPAVYHALQPAFVVNYSMGGKSRFLQVELTVLTRDASVIEVLVQHNPLIRNNLLDVFAEQDINELATAEGKQKLADELTKAIQDILIIEMGRPGIEAILYRSFVMQ